MSLHRYTFVDAYILAELLGRYEVADPQRRIALLAELYQDEDYHAPYEIAALAVNDRNIEVRRWIARHGRYLDYTEDSSQESGEATDPNLWGRLKSDPDPLVRALLRENPDIFPLFGVGKSRQWFAESSHFERLALMRSVRIEEDFIERLFDPQDTELGIPLPERLELCCAFLTNSEILKRNACDAGFADPRKRSWDGGTRYSARHFLNSLWKNAAKWPREFKLQSVVFRYVPADDETKAEAYASCDEPVWRRAILYNSDVRRDHKTLAGALRDRDDGCRELAYEVVADVDDEQITALLKGDDKAALRGLADNRVLSHTVRSDVHERVRQRLRELGESTTAFEDFDLMHVERDARKPAADGKHVSQRALVRRMRLVYRSINEVKARLDRLSSFWSLLFFACAVGLVAAILVRW